MAKQPAAAAAKQPVPYPKNWGQMSTEQKAAWREKYQGLKPEPKTPPLLKSQPPAAAPAPAPAEEEYQEPDQEEPGEQVPEEQCEQIGRDVARELSDENVRSLVGRILRAVADAMDGTGGT